MKLDSFPLYPEKFLSSMDVQFMTSCEFGCFCRLLFYSWIQEPACYLPNNDEELARICRMPLEEWKQISPSVLRKFKPDGIYIYNEVLLQIWNQENKHSRVKSKDDYYKAASALNYTWEQFWNDYGKKIGSFERLVKKWCKLTDKERELIRAYVPKYVASTPDKQYRMNPERFLNQKAWNNEIVSKSKPQTKQLLKHDDQEYRPA